MENITLNDFSGGMVENVSPTDFSPRQWAELKGFVPSEQGVMESQWVFEKVGYNTNGNGSFVNMHAVATDDGVFLFGVKATGRIWFTRVGSTEQDQVSLLENVEWFPVQTIDGDDYTLNDNVRFLCDISFEGYKYGRSEGEVAGLLIEEDNRLGETVPGVLVGSRVRKRLAGDPSSSSSFIRTDAMHVLFMDPNKRWDVVEEKETKWRLVSFPRRDRIRALNAPDDTDLDDFISEAGVYPYAYTDGNGTVLPGVGVIPTANVATVWNNALILGDVYWRKENAQDKPAESGNWKVADLLKNGTVPFEGSVMYGESDIDIFDPRALVRLSQSDAAIQSLHVLNDTLIGITSYAGENDGIIAIRGNLDQLISYDPTVRSNPYAVRREIIRGGMGFPSRNKNNTNGQRRMSCVWPEAGIVVFIDKMGGVFYTNSETVGRLDEYGPTEPSPASLNDTIGAVGRHLFLWRDERLFCLTMVGSGGSDAAGVWTEISLPQGSGNIRALIGAREEMYVLFERTEGSEDYEVWRFSLNCSDEDRGLYFSGTVEELEFSYVPLVVSTRTVAVEGELRSPVWHRFSMAFETPTSCFVSYVSVQGVGAKKKNIESLISEDKVANAQWDLSRSFSYEDEGEFIVPAGIGAQDQASATVVFYGYLRLQSATFTVSGSRLNRGEVPS
jgi:hypothetical protein